MLKLFALNSFGISSIKCQMEILKNWLTSEGSLLFIATVMDSWDNLISAFIKCVNDSSERFLKYNLSLILTQK